MGHSEDVLAGYELMVSAREEGAYVLFEYEFTADGAFVRRDRVVLHHTDHIMYWSIACSRCWPPASWSYVPRPSRPMPRSAAGVNVVRELPKDWSLNGEWRRERLLEEGWAPGMCSPTWACWVHGNWASAPPLRPDISCGSRGRTGPPHAAAVGRGKTAGPFRLAHRVATDQTWTGREPVVLRVRYRISAEVPLTGTTVNPNEGT